MEWNNSLTINASMADISPGVQDGVDARCKSLGRKISRHHRLSLVP
jgi:hypothetical protein